MIIIIIGKPAISLPEPILELWGCCQQGGSWQVPFGCLLPASAVITEMHLSLLIVRIREETQLRGGCLGNYCALQKHPYTVLFHQRRAFPCCSRCSAGTECSRQPAVGTIPCPALPCPYQQKGQWWREKREFSPKARPHCPERNILSFNSVSVSSNPRQGQKQ